jgi:hypothetical protein
MELRLVKVVWEDAWGDKTDEINVEDVAASHTAKKVVTVGWLLLDDASGVSVANEDCGRGWFRGRTFIPRGMNPKVEDIMKPKKRRNRKANKISETLPQEDNS